MAYTVILKDAGATKGVKHYYLRTMFFQLPAPSNNPFLETLFITVRQMKDINAHPLTDSCLCSRIMACSAERERESERKRAREEREERRGEERRGTAPYTGNEE